MTDKRYTNVLTFLQIPKRLASDLQPTTKVHYHTQPVHFPRTITNCRHSMARVIVQAEVRHASCADV